MGNGHFTTDVVVHKANLQLGSGESVSRFTQALNDAGRKYVRQKLNMTDRSGYVFVVEVFADSVIFDVYKPSTVDTEPGTYRFFATKYSRKNGQFSFGELIEVERVTSFKPKSAGVAKAKSAADDFFENLFDDDEEDDDGNADEDELDEKKPRRKKTKKCSGWQRSTKAFWDGVI